MPFHKPFPAFAVLLGISILTACATASAIPPSGHAPDIGEKAAFIASSMIGKPYKYKGNSPSGFDCSGLVQYSYLSAGLDVPHGTKALMDITLSTGEDMRTGDLLFFNERGKDYSHVGIYLGGDTFVHAPGAGGQVRTDSLNDPYWKSSFVEARRFIAGPLNNRHR
jgi:cell wall-associated NlpC family hydrolase